MNDERKIVEKIYKRIDKIAIKGNDYYIDYYKLIDDIINNGKYYYFEIVLYYYYNIDSKIYLSTEELKKKTWKTILFNTNSKISRNIKKILDDNNLYQIGYEICNNEPVGCTVGTIIESQTLYNKTKITNLDVTRYGGTNSATSSVFIDDNDPTLNIDNNLVNRYNLAIQYLIS